MILNLSEYQAAALRTEKPLPTQQERLEHALLGLITETGEITTEVKRMAIYGKPLDDKRRAHIAEEIGDVLWYLAIASDAIGLNIFTTQRLNLPTTTATRLVFSLARVNGALVESLSLGVINKTDIGIELRIALDTLGALANLIDISLDYIAVSNIDKLRERFPEAYSNEAAEARADKGGLDARNS